MKTGTFFKTTVIVQLFLMAAIAAGANTFLIEGFEDPFVNGAPQGWSKSYKTGTLDWVRWTGAYPLDEGAHGGGTNALLYNLSGETYLITPAINFPADINNAVLEFWHKQPEWGSNQDTLKVYYRTTEAGLWNLLATYTSDIDDWTKRTIALPNLSSEYYIGFLGKAKWGKGVCIDDVNIYEGVVETAGGNTTEYYAVICGISDYFEINDLSYCDDDARDVRDALLAMGNWNIANMTVLIDGDATKEAIRTAIQDMAQKADDDDVCLFFFSGHGTNGEDLPPYDESDGLDEYIATYDSLSSSYENDISDDELSDWIGALPTNKYVVLIDSCFSAGAFKSLGAAKTTGRVKGFGFVSSQRGDGFTADIAAKSSTKDLGSIPRGVVISASDDDELSMESDWLENGVFTYYLVAGLAGPADADGDDGISAEECYAYTRPLAAFYNPGQNAQMYDAFPGELYLTNSRRFISKLTVKAGAYAGRDKISASGEIGAAASDFAGAGSVAVAIDSNDMNEPYVMTFPVDGYTFRSGKFSSTRYVNGGKTTFKYNTLTHKFAFSASSIDLTGLSCPATVDIEIGDYNTTLTASETLVNGRKPIPIKLLMGVRDSLRIDKVKLSRGVTDSLTVKGGFSVWNVDVNMADVDFVAEVNEQRFTIPAGRFRAGKKGYYCSKVPINEGGVATANFNFRTGAFTLTIKLADILSGPGETAFKIEFDEFSESDDVVLP